MGRLKGGDGPEASAFKERFAKRLIELRGEHTQQEVADALGISRDRLAKYEGAASEPPLWVLARIADTFRISLDFLITGTEARTLGAHRLSAVCRKIG